MPVTIKSSTEEHVIENRKDKYLSFIIQQAGMPLDLQCSGLGICGKCAVELGPGEYLVSNEKKTVSEGHMLKALSCRTKILSENAHVFVPREAILKSEGKIYDDFDICEYNFDSLTKKILVTIPESSLENPISDWDRMKGEINKQIDMPELSCSLGILRKLPLLLDESSTMTATVGRFQKQWHLVDLEAGNATDKNMGVAIDIGTTTVVALLVDMNAGRILGKASCYNKQMSSADDVASRISVASSAPDQLQYMKDLIVSDTINPLIKELCDNAGKVPDDVQRLVVSGNTVMCHLFMGLSPKSIGLLPFQPVTNIYADSLGGELGLSMHGSGIVNIVPSISGYIGGDITSDIYVTGMTDCHDLTALIDLGTNSEMVLADRGKLFAAAAAAGPAFEGAGLICGCRAITGAVERIKYGSDLDFEIGIIGNARPVGICGSAIIDFIAEGFRCGLINSMGRFDLQMLKDNNKYMEAELFSKKYHACVLVGAENSDTGKPIIVTEGDLEQILKAKGAVYAGLKTLLSERGLTFKDLKRIILAGGFAKYINVKNAICIGMLPEVPFDIYDSIGNGSLAGAYLALIDPLAREAYRDIITKPDVVALNTIPDFEMSFVDALMLPNYNESEFPETMAELNN